MKRLVIDGDKCISCKACVEDCIAFALTMADRHPVFAPGGEDRCIGCQHCLAVCPTGALSILGRDPEASEAPRPLPEPEEVLRLMKSRRSCRHYRQRSLEPERLEKLIAAMAWTPTGVNDHRLHFAVVSDIKAMNALRARVNAALVKAVETGTLPPVVERFAWMVDSIASGGDPIFRTAPHLVLVSAPEDAPCKLFDPTIALSYFELYAHSLGVGTTWCGLGYLALTVLTPELLPKLGVPEGYRPGYLMLFGPPALHYSRCTQPEPADVSLIDELR